MAALNVEFTDTEMDRIRRAAASDEIAVKKFAHDAVVDALLTREVLAAGLAVVNDPDHAELLKRLAK